MIMKGCYNITSIFDLGNLKNQLKKLTTFL